MSNITNLHNLLITTSYNMDYVLLLNNINTDLGIRTEKCFQVSFYKVIAFVTSVLDYFIQNFRTLVNKLSSYD